VPCERRNKASGSIKAFNFFISFSERPVRDAEGRIIFLRAVSGTPALLNRGSTSCAEGAHEFEILLFYSSLA
jgi:hypothetical protein